MSLVSYYLEGVTALSVCCIGLVINAAAIVMLLRQKNNGSVFLKLMISLATYDLFYVFLSSICFSLTLLSPYFKDRVAVYFVPYLMPVTQMSLSGGTFTTVALTVERYISVCMPFFRQRHNPKAWMFLTPVAVFVFVYSIPRFFELETRFKLEKICPPEATNEDNSTVMINVDNSAMDNNSGLLPNGSLSSSCEIIWHPHLGINELRFNPYYVSIYANWMNLIVNIVLPLALLVTMNIKIYRAMKGQLWYKAKKDECGGDSSRRSYHHHTRFSMTSRNAATSTSGCKMSQLSSKGPTIKWKRGSPEGPMEAAPGTQRSAPNSLRRVAGINEHELKKRDAKYTRASVVMVVVFVVCNGPRFIPNVMELIISHADFPKWAFVLISINHLLTVLNSSFNFLIYLSFCGRRKRKRRAFDDQASTWRSVAFCCCKNKNASFRDSPSAMELTVKALDKMDQHSMVESTTLMSPSGTRRRDTRSSTMSSANQNYRSPSNRMAANPKPSNSDVNQVQVVCTKPPNSSISRITVRDLHHHHRHHLVEAEDQVDL